MLTTTTRTISNPLNVILLRASVIHISHWHDHALFLSGTQYRDTNREPIPWMLNRPDCADPGINRSPSAGDARPVGCQVVHLYRVDRVISCRNGRITRLILHCSYAQSFIHPVKSLSSLLSSADIIIDRYRNKHTNHRDTYDDI